MSKKISDELKEAILHMPDKEKDKLLIRLISKDPMLIKKLHHQLLEDEVDMEAKRDELMQGASSVFSREDFHHWTHTPGLVMMVLRDFSGAISQHVKITKDKYGEIQLLVLLVNLPFRKQSTILYENQHRADKFAEYVCKKAQTALKKLEKMDRDFYLEFDKDVNEMLGHLKAYPPTSRLMSTYHLPPSWEY
ncbi:hypothetical protein WJR50_12135 [Catalinimonas sp. 4WD22]|uniref:hypothetical protein n=1 Tax=Catalinimonas locisalis TaxID=3133978 RepID=UPI003101708F